MVYVTHDQSEALTMSDRIAVFHHGKIQQLDVPARIYEEPVNAFVARFIGENNRLDGVIESADSVRCTVRLAGNASIEGSLAEDLAPGMRVTGEAVALTWAPEHCRAFARENVHRS